MVSSREPIDPPRFSYRISLGPMFIWKTLVVFFIWPRVIWLAKKKNDSHGVHTWCLRIILTEDSSGWSTILIPRNGELMWLLCNFLMKNELRIRFFPGNRKSWDQSQKLRLNSGRAMAIPGFAKKICEKSSLNFYVGGGYWREMWCLPT